jgi:hypothetical protein
LIIGQRQHRTCVLHPCEMFVSTMSRTSMVVCGYEVGACVKLQRNLQTIGFIADIFLLDHNTVPANGKDYSVGFFAIPSSDICDLNAEVAKMKTITNCNLIVGVVQNDQQAMKSKCLDCGMADAVGSNIDLDALYECICSLCYEVSCFQPMVYQEIAGEVKETSFNDLEAVKPDAPPRKMRPRSNSFDAFGLNAQHEEDAVMHEIWVFGTNSPVLM